MTQISDSPPPPGAAPHAFREPNRRITFALWGFLALVLCAVAAFAVLHRQVPQPAAAPGRSLDANADRLPPYYHVPVFSLTDQNGQNVTDKSLRGHVWLCDFIFTRCAGPCRDMSSAMAGLTKSLSDARLNFVSFTVDPEYDTPEHLKTYAAQWAPHETRWKLLTGTVKQMYDTAAGMKLTAIPATPTAAITHDEHFLLIDAEGQVRGIYDSKDAEKMGQLPADVQTLLSEKSASPEQMGSAK